MKVLKLSFTLFLIILVWSSASAQVNKVDALEKRIDALEKRVVALENQLNSSTQTTKVTPRPNPNDKSVWRALKKGMTQSNVRDLLGEPLNIKVFGSSTWWYYSKASWHSKVIFYNDLVDGWDEPE